MGRVFGFHTNKNTRRKKRVLLVRVAYYAPCGKNVTEEPLAVVPVRLTIGSA